MCKSILLSWNYVVHRKDRWCSRRKEWTGRSNTREAENADSHTFLPAGLHELYQENHTYFSPAATSRIDRVYTNHHITVQLDHKFGCTTLPAPRDFCRTRPSPTTARSPRHADTTSKPPYLTSPAQQSTTPTGRSESLQSWIHSLRRPKTSPRRS